MSFLILVSNTAIPEVHLYDSIAGIEIFIDSAEWSKNYLDNLVSIGFQSHLHFTYLSFKNSITFIPLKFFKTSV